MKIGSSDGNGSLAPAGGARSTATEATGSAGKATVTPAPAQGTESSAKVQLSETASTLMSGSTSGDFDAEKVARISKQIADGTFKVNHEAIADKLIANAQELLGKSSSV